MNIALIIQLSHIAFQLHVYVLQAVEMARPHWLDTFNGLVLVTPGWPTNFDACYDKPAPYVWRSKWRDFCSLQATSLFCCFFLHTIHAYLPQLSRVAKL